MTLTLKIANQSVCKTLWLRMMYLNTKFGSKMFGSLEDIIWTNIHWTLAMTLTLNAVILFFSFSEDTLAYDEVRADQVWLPKSQQFQTYSRKRHILINEPSL